MPHYINFFWIIQLMNLLILDVSLDVHTREVKLSQETPHSKRFQ